MNSQSRSFLRSLGTQLLSLLIVVVLFASPICAQRPAPPAKTPVRPQAAPQAPEPTFDNLLGADRYKLYGEIRNVGQLMSTGGAGEIVDPIIKLADPPKEFSSIITFLKKNAEALAASRLLFATWPSRTDVPNAFVAIEFASNEEAAKFAPKLEKFLPTVLPPVPEPTPEPTEAPSGPAQARTSEPSQQQPVAEPKKETVVAPPATPQPPVTTPASTPAVTSPPPAERLPFVISHSGNLVFISDQPFKFEKLHPVGTKALTEDQNFRIAHDRFSTEPVFVFFNVLLEEKGKAKPPQTIADAEAEQVRKIEEAKAAEAEAQEEMARSTNSEPATTPEPDPDRDNPNERRVAVLTAGPEPSPTPTPTKEQQAQAIASAQMGRMFNALGFGEPQWPEAVGLALALDNSDYVIKAILIDSPDAKKLPIPFVPQLISGPSFASEAPSVLPDDTEVFVTASIDLLQTYEGMRKEAEIKAKAEPRQIPAGGKEPPLDAFAEFEKKAGFKIKDDLLPALGNEIALAGSLKSLQGAGGPFNIVPSSSARPAVEPDGAKTGQEKKGSDVFPMLLIAVKDRDAARRLMPRVLDGLGIGEANLIAQVEKREDTELVNYAGVFAYAFVGNFVVISEAATVRRVIDATVNHQTLSSNTAFRNSRRWEPSRTLGQIYVSPALMEGYHEEIRKSVGSNVDATMREFLLGLDPTATAITYALSNDGLGTQHEIHLPKNLIITMVAGISSATRNPPPEANEMIAAGALQMIASAEGTYLATAGKGSYGTLDQLTAQKLVMMDAFQKYGYKFEVTASGDHFEAIATPKEYGTTGKRSFFVDKSGVVRGDDHGGGPATAADRPIQ